jgi:hypothetical protein
MRRRPSPSPATLPFAMAELALASWETIYRRSLLMARGTCTRAEYTRMVLEKMAAIQDTTKALSKPWTEIEPHAVISPWHRRARGNARRLRR